MSYIDNTTWLLASRVRKEDFISEFKDLIIHWTKDNEEQLLRILTEKQYSWKGESFEKSANRRNVLEAAITRSRCINNSGVDLETLNKITMWGFGRNFPLTNRMKH